MDGLFLVLILSLSDLIHAKMDHLDRGGSCALTNHRIRVLARAPRFYPPPRPRGGLLGSFL